MYLSSYYRINTGKIDIFDYKLDVNNFSFLEISEKQKFTRADFKELNNELNEQYKHFYNEDIKNGKDEYEETYTDIIIKQFIIDRFTFRDRCMIMYFLIQEKIEANEIDIDILNTIRNYYNKMIIYYDKKNNKYYISDKNNKSNKKPWGFFLYDYLRSDGGQEYIICFKYDEETKERAECKEKGRGWGQADRGQGRSSSNSKDGQKHWWRATQNQRPWASSQRPWASSQRPWASSQRLTAGH